VNHPDLPEIVRLRDLIAESGLTRADVADRAGLTPGNLSRLLSGRRSPHLETVRRVLVALGSEDWGDLGPIRRDGNHP
jgi:transcriptional regulator with XRE-family HTH domain